MWVIHNFYCDRVYMVIYGWVEGWLWLKEIVNFTFTQARVPVNHWNTCYVLHMCKLLMMLTNVFD